MANRSRVVPHPPNAVMSALRTVASRNKWRLDDDSPGDERIRFHTGLSFWTWSGQNAEVGLTSSPEGTRIDVETRIRRTGLSLLQFIDWGEGRRLADKVISETCRELGVSEAGTGA